MSKKKDIIRPIYGTLALQPLAFAWAYYQEIDYISTLGAFTVISTIYLMPVYSWFEKIWPNP